MRCSPVFKTILGILTLALVGVSEGKCAEGEPIPEDELLRFLGPVPRDQVTWSVLKGPDFTVYYGRANPPLAGSLGFYLGGAPRKIEPAQTTFRSRLGRFPVEWHRSVSNEGSIRQETIVRISGYKAHVWVDAPSQTEMNKLLAVLGQLPTFANGTLPVGYEEIGAEFAREELISWLIWLGWSAALLAGAWLVDRICRRQKFSPQGRLLAFAGVVVATILITIGGLALSATLWTSDDRYAANFVIHWFHVAKGLLLITAAAAIAGLTLLSALGLFLVRQIQRTSRPKPLAAR
jgi:hypothetical protein